GRVNASAATIANKVSATQVYASTVTVSGANITGVNGNTAIIASVSGAVTSGHTAVWDASGNLTDGGSSGVILQQVRTETGAVSTGSTTIPLDDSIPQSSEGDQYMTLAITPISATSKLVIDVVGFFASSANDDIVMALFQDSTANALAAGTQVLTSVNLNVNIKFSHTMTSGTTSATTFKVRAGLGSAGTLTFNGKSGARLFGGVMASSIIITEYAS
ncbi:MAG: hypothetical protein V4440_11095, partial [Pseudomonadota bacterium]